MAVRCVIITAESAKNLEIREMVFSGDFERVVTILPEEMFEWRC